MRAQNCLVNISNQSKIYIVSPFIQTGGPHSLHQLVHLLKEYGCDAAIKYFPEPIGKRYSESLYPQYDISVAEKIEDTQDNIIIVSETCTELLKKFSHIQKCVWWLSLDFHFFEYIYPGSKISLRNRQWTSWLLPFMMGYKLLSKVYKREPLVLIGNQDFSRAVNLYNCEYVHRYLQEHNVPNEKMHYLCGPLEKIYMADDRNDILVGKQNTIIYSPKKMDKRFFQKVKEAIEARDKKIKFIPIRNMNREQVFSTERRAKLYLDFGFFPGPERIPREAVSLYCNIITSDIGAAKNGKDVCIPDRYKFELKDENVEIIANLAVNMVHNYEDYIGDFELYRDKVKEQIERFDGDIREIFGLKNIQKVIS